jgi:ATP-dependent helicase HrpB
MLQQAEAALDRPLPISAVLSSLVEQLGAAGSAVLVSPPGTGKTTLVPLALADRVSGRVVVAEPRRVAARAAARRMAWLLGEEVGDRVGYTVRGDRKVGPRTRIEVVTTGVLVQRLQRDAELPGVGAVMLDECHERHLDTDLALAFGIESRAALRPDLLLLATSATAEADRLATVLGRGGPDRSGGSQPAPVIGADAPPPWSAARSSKPPTMCWCSCRARARSGPWRTGWALRPTSTCCACTGGWARPTRTRCCGRPSAAGSCWPAPWPRAA